MLKPAEIILPLAFCVLLALPTVAKPLQNEATSNDSHQRPTIALALGGGGVRGAALIGVLRVLEANHIPIDYIAGCSMGSIIGGLYCAGVPLKDIEAMMQDQSLQNAYAHGFLPMQVCRYEIGKLKYVFSKNKPGTGLFSGRQFTSFLSRYLPDGKRNVEDLNIPFCSEATSLTDGQAHWLTKGDLCQVILASSAIPPIIRPVEINGQLYVDGSLRANTPVLAAKEFHPNLVIAVPIDATLKTVDKSHFKHTMAVASRMTDIFVDVGDCPQLKQANIIIRPEITSISILSKKRDDVGKAIAAGALAATEALPQIKQAIADFELAQTAADVKQLSKTE